MRYFGTDGIRSRVGVEPITAAFILKLGWAVGRVLAAEHGKGFVLIGKDTRISGYMFEAALEAGLSAAGVDIRLLGPMPTPAIAYLTRTLHARAGLVISASHNPYYDNGIKLFSPQGTKLPEALEAEIEDMLGEPMVTVDSASLGKAERVPDAPGRYIEFCKRTIPARVDLACLKLVIDCANGAAYHVAPRVFEELGAQVIELATAPDGLNINAGCGSTHPEALQAAVLEHQADAGIALDGDGDRVIMVDHTGEVVDGDELLFIIAQERHKAQSLQGAVVGTVMSNLGLEQALAANNIAFHRTAVGDHHVLEMLHKNDWHLGGESSGHIICLDRTSTGDGIVSALQVLAEIAQTGKPLYELKTGMIKYPQRLINVPVAGKVDLTADALRAAVRVVEQQLGVRGRVLLRASGTEPVLRVMVEGEDAAEVEQLAQQLAADVAQTVDAASTTQLHRRLYLHTQN